MSTPIPELLHLAPGASLLCLSTILPIFPCSAHATDLTSGTVDKSKTAGFAHQGHFNCADFSQVRLDRLNIFSTERVAGARLKSPGLFNNPSTIEQLSTDTAPWDWLHLLASSHPGADDVSWLFDLCPLRRSWSRSSLGHPFITRAQMHSRTHQHTLSSTTLPKAAIIY